MRSNSARSNKETRSVKKRSDKKLSAVKLKSQGSVEKPRKRRREMTLSENRGLKQRQLLQRQEMMSSNVENLKLLGSIR